MIINFVPNKFVAIETEDGDLLKVDSDNPNWLAVEFAVKTVERAVNESLALAEVLKVVNKSIKKADRIRAQHEHPKYLEGKSLGIKDGRSHKAREFYEDERDHNLMHNLVRVSKKFVNGYLDGYKQGRNGK